MPRITAALSHVALQQSTNFCALQHRMFLELRRGVFSACSFGAATIAPVQTLFTLLQG
jgi:hypothetical protein